jgi:hypothetical protein
MEEKASAKLKMISQVFLHFIPLAPLMALLSYLSGGTYPWDMFTQPPLRSLVMCGL